MSLVGAGSRKGGNDVAAATQPDPSSRDVPAEAGAFLDNYFRSQVSRKSRGPGTSTLAAVDAALMTLLLVGDGGVRLVLALAAAVREAERELDALVDRGCADVGFHRAYEVVARRRSAVEFLRLRFEAAGVASIGGAIASARQALDSAVGELDDTIAGYTKEGYDLACPRLAATSVAQGTVPYAHWWIFLGRPYSEGWAVLR